MLSKASVSLTTEQARLFNAASLSGISLQISVCPHDPPLGIVFVVDACTLASRFAGRDLN